MACFIAPMSVGIVTTLFRKKIPENLKIGWLNMMIWGGAIMLAVEHIAHEEIVLYPPFLTAMQTPAEIPVMLQEMAVVGGTMTIAIVLIWSIMVYVYNKKIHVQKILLKN
ncbi:hypothetical protein MBGDN05_00819 [Thermoplasmatales archaeon SCGC AB-539-N05]|nr:hypothetical protein MBGDN05_00819 [Thermoplasmatales archaeon SCGC AB-539-N05]